MKERGIRISWRAVLLGSGMGLLSMICAAVAAAALMAGGAVGLDRMGLFAAGILVGCGMVGTLTALLGGGGAVDGALTALAVLVVLFGLNLLLNGGEMEGVAVTALALAGGCGAGLLLRLGKGSGRRRGKRKNRYSAQKSRR